MTTIEELATQRALSSKEAFIASLDAIGVLVRLDERGGRDEPAPWAFHGIPRAAVLPPREDEDVDVQALRESLGRQSLHDEETTPFGTSEDAFTDSAPDEPTITAERPKMLPLPAARGAASVLILPEGAKELVVGRLHTADIEIAERSISRHHAVFRRQSDGLRLSDLGGSNGTAINDRTIGTGGALVRSGDVVSFGDVRCLFLSPLELYTYLPRLSD